MTVLDETSRSCRGCGCSGARGCPGGCCWVGDDDLCTRCAVVVAIPDDGGEVLFTLGLFGDLVAALDAAVVDGLDEGAAAIRVLTVVRARHALERVTRAVVRTTSVPASQPVAPDGRFELVPLWWAVLAAGDVVDLSWAGLALGTAWVARDELVADVLVDLGRDDLVAQLIRLNGLLPAPLNVDVARLAGALRPGAGRVVLSASLMEAYDRLTGRIITTWHAGDPLSAWLYRGAARC